MTMQKKNQVSKKWLLAAADFEAEHGYFSVAGNASTGERSRGTSMDRLPHESQSVGAFAQLFEFGRRRLGLSVEALADKANIDLEDLVEIERSDAKPSPRTLHRLAEVLQLPPEPLAEVAGLVKTQDEILEEAVYRFAARSEPNSSLNPQEEDAYTSFVNVLLSLKEHPK